MRNVDAGGGVLSNIQKMPVVQRTRVLCVSMR